MTRLVAMAKPMDMSCEASFWLEWLRSRNPASEPARRLPQWWHGTSGLEDCPMRPVLF